MESKILVYALAVWSVFFLIATIISRAISYFRELGADTSMIYWVHIILLIVTLFILTFLLIKKSGVSFLQNELIAVGVIWLILSLIVDLIFGLPWGGRYWHTMISKDIFLNDINLIILILQLLAPLITNFVVES